MLRIDSEQLASVDMKRILEHLIEKHQPARAEKLQDYYIGKHDILDRRMADPTKPNNKIVNNLAAYITDTLTGYFMGKPVSYSADEGNEEYLETLQLLFDDNDEQDQNAELAKGQSVQGVDYELLYLDEEANVRFANMNRQSVIYVETDDVAAEPALAVRIYDIDVIGGEQRHYYDVYTEDEIITYEMVTVNEAKSLREIGRQRHFFGGVPVVAYMNNEEMLGDFEGVMTLIDAYNQAQSDTANDFEYFTDAYLKLTGIKLDDEQIATMRENRVIGLPDKECSADWLIKELNDAAIENFKNRLRKDIHALSKTPNLTDEQFAGQLSGVAIAYKMWGMEQIAAIKERKFKKGLQRRLELITNILNLKGKQYDWKAINITFSRNMPQNLVEIVQMVSQLKGIVSDETLLSQLPFVEDVASELEALEAARETIDLDSIQMVNPVGGDVEDESEE
jgi:SPP1 family phage portal protein